MSRLSKTIMVSLRAEEAFTCFVEEINNWWPREYTWSQDGLEEIKMTPEKDGLCTEIGPHGFRCDWGRITIYSPYTHLAFKWQIGPQRAPEPNPEKASDVIVNFKQNSEGNTIIEFAHMNFEKHGSGAEEYHKAMDSEYGWDYILQRFKQYCETL